MENAFAAGDVVELKSGGATMTVDAVTQAGLVSCVWHDGKKAMQAFYQPTSLKKYEPPNLGVA